MTIVPILLFGLAGLVVAVRHALSPSRARLALLVGIAVATVLLGAIGTIAGLRESASHIGQVAEPVKIFLFGMAESLGNLVVALVLVTVQALVGTLGEVRAARALRPAVPVADPALPG